MDEPTLQSVLRQKYNINDRLLAEGRFVGLMGDHAANLVCLGLGIRCLIVARVVLSGDVIDYDLISITPLPVLSLSFQNTSKKIKVRSQFKATQVFQMCTSAKQAEVWDNFTSTIKEVYLPGQGDTWCSTTLHFPNASPSTNSTDFEQASSVSSCQNSNKISSSSSRVSSQRNNSYSSFTSCSEFERRSLSHSSYISNSTLSYRSYSSLRKFDTRLSESSVSLPTKLPSHIDENNNWIFPSRRSNSADLLDVKFERFVNDSPELLEGQKDDYVTYAWAGSVQDSYKLNVSNNYVRDNDYMVAETPAEEVQEETTGSPVRRFFRRAWYCCTGKKTVDA